MVHLGPAIGGEGGGEFNLYRDKPVKQLDVWYGSGSGDQFKQYTVLKGIELRWNGDENPARTGSTPSDTNQSLLHTSFDFENDGHEDLEWMDIWGSAGRVDSLRFLTERKKEGDYFAAGGVGGGKRIQPAHDRELCGFYGRSGDDIDKLGAVFNF
ncbi:hypothetical protein N8T08_011089 [Aspergillus melleus]|uniref:Uncharacterized protein n=1 Tax=Aspergillus melleus TaxID=138277 RepID=A0ACC3AQ48_9EURO|nr:hypothetical protein N8T08_011089 [Aspergillus melleus]